jgi:ParB family chromosome partitioning protein
MVQQGEVTQGHARALLPLGDEGEQIQFAERIKKEGMSVRATEQAVHDHIHQLDGDLLSLIDAEGNRKPVQRPTMNSQVAALEAQLRSVLGTKVDLKQTAKGRGRMTIHFKNHDEFDRLYSMMTQSAELRRESA